jgi:hypothetical protein
VNGTFSLCTVYFCPLIRRPFICLCLEAVELLHGSWSSIVSADFKAGLQWGSDWMTFFRTPKIDCPKKMSHTVKYFGYASQLRLELQTWRNQHLVSTHLYVRSLLVSICHFNVNSRSNCSYYRETCTAARRYSRDRSKWSNYRTFESRITLTDA